MTIVKIAACNFIALLITNAKRKKLFYAEDLLDVLNHLKADASPNVVTAAIQLDNIQQKTT